MMAKEDFEKMHSRLTEGVEQLIRTKGWEEGTYVVSFRQNMASPNMIEMRLRSEAPEEQNKEIDGKAREILREFGENFSLNPC